MSNICNLFATSRLWIFAKLGKTHWDILMSHWRSSSICDPHCLRRPLMRRLNFSWFVLCTVNCRPRSSNHLDEYLLAVNGVYHFPLCIPEWTLLQENKEDKGQFIMFGLFVCSYFGPPLLVCWLIPSQMVHSPSTSKVEDTQEHRDSSLVSMGISNVVLNKWLKPSGLLNQNYYIAMIDPYLNWAEIVR